MYLPPAGYSAAVHTFTSNYCINFYLFALKEPKLCFQFKVEHAALAVAKEKEQQNFWTQQANIEIRLVSIKP